MTKLKLIGLAGTNGSGKDTVGHFLADTQGYLFVSVTDLLRSEAKRRQLQIDREVLRTISAEWRRELGLGVLVDKAVAKYNAQVENYRGIIVASIRNPGEADRVHQFGGSMVWLDGDPRIRYERIQANAASRNRAEEDQRTYEQFLADEAAEMHSPEGGDAATLNMSEVKRHCDVIINNDSKDIHDFQHMVEKALKQSRVL